MQQNHIQPSKKQKGITKTYKVVKNKQVKTHSLSKMNVIKGLFKDKEQGIHIQAECDLDSSLYLGNHFTLTSNKDITTLRTRELVLDTAITIQDYSIQEGEWVPTYVSMNEDGSLVVRRYTAPLYMMGGLVLYWWARSVW